MWGFFVGVEPRGPYYGRIATETNEVWEVVATLARSGCQAAGFLLTVPKGGCEWGGVRFHEFWISIFQGNLSMFWIQSFTNVNGETLQKLYSWGVFRRVSLQVWHLKSHEQSPLLSIRCSWLPYGMDLCGQEDEWTDTETARTMQPHLLSLKTGVWQYF